MTDRRARQRSGMRGWTAVALVGAALALGACEGDMYARGNQPKPSDLSQLQPGRSSRSDVQALLGSPSATSMFGGETWYYISALTQQYAFFPREEMEREVVAIRFDDRGMIEDMRTLTKADGNDIAVSGRETPTRGNELSIVQELFGNIGRFSTGDNDDGSPGQN